jgi:PAS domain S-box-containing protein
MSHADDPRTTVFAGPGEMAARLRAIDWAQTPLGPVAGWSPTLLTMVRFLLASRFPLLLWWGPEYVQLYNDAYIPVPGTKHPGAAGQRASECWTEIWQVIGPLVDGPFRGGPATWVEDLELEVHRHGFTEETHFTVAYSAVPDDTAPGGIGGVMATVHEITRQVVQERRVVALRDLGARTTGAKTAEDACRHAADAFGRHPKDVPFALIYLVDESGTEARLAGLAGARQSPGTAPLVVDLRGPGRPDEWPLAEVLRTGKSRLVTDIGRCCDPVPSGPWSDAPEKAMVLPIPSTAAQRLAGFLVLGVSARLAFDDLYEGFFELATTPVATAIANARAFEEERRRADALAELDRAKTAFFSNVSHEFRTPLTLMLGPLEEAMAAPDVPRSQRDALDVAHRNSLRLLRLVNTLLDFSRIEAGRVDAVFEPVDVALLTSELASVFRSAIERAGLSLAVHCEESAASVFLDRDMWEKIVLNLLSNAFKFTFAGGITLSLSDRGDAIELAVRDTGVGIPADELPHVFERFHRVRGTEGRTHEGTGIGLALVADLVRLHGGRVDVQSVLGAGSTFVVRIPTGSAHLPKDRIGGKRLRTSTALGAAPFIEEALRWLPDDDVPARTVEPDLKERVTTSRACVLVADDNADMRSYVVRLLEPYWHVEAVGDGEAALAAMAERPPDLVLSDVMMPRLDGIALTRAIRADPALRSTPVILLSARAGEEARIEGVDAGADDYLVKPFSARELAARVNVHLELARVRREAAEEIRQRGAQFEALLNAAPVGVYLVDADFRIREVNPVARPVFGDVPDLVGRDFDEVIHRLWSREYADEIVRIFRHTLETGEPHFTAERNETRRDRGVTETYESHVHRLPLPDGRYGVVCYFRDISAQVAVRERIIASEERARFLQGEAEAANRAKDEFLATVSHELRSPLQGILGWLSLLKRGRLEPGQTVRALEAVERSVRLQAQLVHDIMDISRIEAGKLELDEAPLDLAALVTSTADEFMPGAVAKSITLEVDCEPSGLVVGDRERLHQVFSNLVMNALKFTPAGRRITLSCRREAEEIVTKVIDTGHGIEPEFLPRLFDRFTQADSSSTRRYGGLGLGLAIVRHLVERHGGRVSAESAGAGRGATFCVRLPAALAHETPGAAPREATLAVPLDGIEILLVEDDQDALEAMTLALQATGARVRPAASAGEAWSTLARHTPDVVVSDLSMPDEDGYSLLRRIQGSRAHRGVPTIALTGFTRSEDRARVLSAGFAAHVPKPIDPDQLIRVVADVLDARRRMH